ncbi:DNA mismatch repair endonuclease MutL [Ehrlichia ruminantium]|uniref:DNA mismatch repair protein MutL n=1 Tax=Ehrlichia ruminantium (strain Welgevonden) TaxID=254945 RepID=A0A0H3M7U3_EHRRW|nr:DNA mismatch repair endonuclease MutL [Ehrlichia ruminantium]QLK54888.1 DNA mismatch repair endonuclease MutL [Ehrlichia ruminantium]UOD99909.1 DNA mismatch repair endonuclease MutL [Ehrlichia ruminantium]CAH57931.1 DNA mismatch repair protein MutL [Ehrlichia ruminantium str. Welgevonden]CAI26709.1 DNA mismatch repair protein MutL [Ehrlichia ruminantium str. Welgevonden]
MSIVLLDSRTINRIAAGEVIECPASVVKELVENSIDAKATTVSITIERGGRNLILVCDDGIGIKKEDMEIAFVRHATSKLPDGDLTKVKSLGFRGEGLTSIAAVSKVKMVSRCQGSDTAWSIEIEGGEKVQELIPNPLSCGTYIEVRDLFFATPNRLKFLKTEKAEVQSIIDMVNKLAMVNHDIKFSLCVDGKQVFKYLKQQSEIDRLAEIKILGTGFYENSLPVHFVESMIALTGYIGIPTMSRGKSSLIYTFVNGRPIYDNMLVGAVRYAYSDFIERDKYPIVVLYINMPYDQVDTNVHPNKSEVRFQDKRLIYKVVVNAIKNALAVKMNNKFRSDNNFSEDPFEKDNIAKVKNLGVNSPSFQFVAPSSHEQSSKDNKEQYSCISDFGIPNSDKQLFIRNNLSVKSDQTLSNTSDISVNDDLKEFFVLQDKTQIEDYKIDTSILNQGNECFKLTGKSHDIISNVDNKREHDTHLSLNAVPKSISHKQENTLVDCYPLGYAICQVHSRYIVAQTKDGIVIVDQHAAHERLIYEYMKQVMEKEGVKRQILLIPEVVEMNNGCDLELLMEYKNKLLKLGLLIESLGDLSVIVREVPAVFGSFDVKALIFHILDSIAEVGDTLFLNNKIKDICGTIACYSSIRSGRKLKIEEMNALLRNMENTSYSGQCNHGRPTYIKLSLLEIDKLFLRR